MHRRPSFIGLFLLGMLHRLLKRIHHGKQIRVELVDTELFGLQHIGFCALAGVFDFRHRADIHVVVFSDLLLGLLKLSVSSATTAVSFFSSEEGFLSRTTQVFASAWAASGITFSVSCALAFCLSHAASVIYSSKSA